MVILSAGSLLPIFNGKKLETVCPSDHVCMVPTIIRNEYQLLDIDEDNFVSLVDSSGITRDDISLPKGTDKLDKLTMEIRSAFAAGHDTILTIISAMGEEQIQSIKKGKSATCDGGDDEDD